MASFLLLLGVTGSPGPEKQTMKLSEKDPAENKESQQKRKVVSPVLFVFPLPVLSGNQDRAVLPVRSHSPGGVGGGE